MDVLYTSFVCLISNNFHSTDPERVKNISHSCTRSYFFTPSMIFSSLAHLYPRVALFRATNRWKSEEEPSGLYGGWGRRGHASFVIGSSVCSCGVVWTEEFSNGFVRQNA